MTTTSTPAVLRLLAEQRKRCLATMFTNAEATDWWIALTAAEQQAFRDSIRQSLAVFYELARDMLKISDDGQTGTVLHNELALDLIRSIHTQQQQIVEKLDR